MPFTVRPLTIEIKNSGQSIVAHKRYEIKCESSGSRPNSIITWYKANHQLRRTKVCIVIKYLQSNEFLSILILYQ